jgi:recombination protein RecA
MKIGVMFGNPETTSGGRALKFYASVRLEIRRTESIKSGADITGGRHKVKVVKNKVAPPFRVAEFDIMYNEGISTAGNLLDVGTELGIVRKSGAWFYLDEERIGQGRENAKEFVKSHPEMAAEIERRIKGVGDTTPAVPVLAGVGVVGEEDDDYDEEDEG